MALDKISVSGGYAGASPDNLDKMAVSNIEDEIKNISGISEVESTIRSGAFSIVVTLKKNTDKNEVLNKIKDALSLVKSDLPSDMNEPNAMHVESKIPLMQVAISSDSLSHDALIEVAKDIKRKLSRIENLTDVVLYGESDKEIKILVDSKKIDAYGVAKSGVMDAISSLSYIFPIGKIEELGNHMFVSTTYGKASREEFMETLITVGGKRLRIGDIADVIIGYPKGETISSFNGKNSLNINISKDTGGNAIVLSKKVKEILKKYEKEYQDISIDSYSDTSVYIKNRLNTVISNISLGFLLVTISMYFLINGRISIVVAAGIPFSFIIGLIFFEFSGNSINMISLLGALIAVGVLVDDAIIVSENIQRHIEEGMDTLDAAVLGTKEVAVPVIMATLTTMFAFVPMLLMSGEMGEFIKMIPVAVCILIVASLIESFFFLPLHAKHLMKKDSHTLSWEKANALYRRIISKLIHFKKSSLAFFLIVIPLLTILGFKMSKFQFFPPFDSTMIYVNGKFDVNQKVEDTSVRVEEISKLILSHKEEFFIKSVSAVSGFSMGGGEPVGENGSNLFVLFVELYEPKGENIVERYITPVLSFNFDNEEKIRTSKTFELEKKIKELVAPFKAKYAMEELNVESQRAGVVNRDIEIKLISNNDEKLLGSIKHLKEELGKIEGVTNIGDDARIGIPELKIKLNNYGESLGLTEAHVARTISSFLLSSAKAKSYDQSGIVEIITEDENKDKLDYLKGFTLTLGDGRKVLLEEIATLSKEENFEKIAKENGEKQKSVFAFVEADKITALEVLKKLEPILKEISDSGITVKQGGEKEQTEQLRHDMMVASVIALFLMFLSLLFMFGNFGNVFMILSVIPFSFLGVVYGHFLMGLNLTMPSIIGILGLAGVVINDGIVMLEFIRKVTNGEELLRRASIRLRPIILTSITTLIGLSTLIFFPSGQAKILQPLAVSLGFGLAWGTVLNLLYLPVLFAVVKKIKI